MAKAHNIKSVTAGLARGKKLVDPFAMRANIRSAFFSGRKIALLGFVSGILAVMVPLGLYIAAYLSVSNNDFTRQSVEQLLAHIFSKAEIEFFYVSVPVILYINMAALFLLIGFSGMISAIIRRGIIRKRSNRSFLKGKPRVWFEAMPFVTIVLVASAFQRSYSLVYIIEAALLFLLWNFWYSVLLGGRKK